MFGRSLLGAVLCSVLAGSNTTVIAQEQAVTAPDAAAAAAQNLTTSALLKDVAPIVVQHCVRCHNSRRRSAGLALDTAAGVAAGGDSGQVFEPRKSDESLLIQKVRGTAEDGQRMPLGRGALSDEEIARLASWVDAGAAIDLPQDDQAKPLADLLRRAEAQGVSDEELSRRRRELAQQHWQLALSDLQPQMIETERLLLVGSGTQESLRELGERAETVWTKVVKQWRLKVQVTPARGRLTLFALERRFDYQELRQMLGRVPPEKSATLHWHCDPLDAYVALALPAEEESGSAKRRVGEVSSAGELTTDAALAYLLAGYWLAERSEVPAWFAEGAAWQAAARVAPKCGRWRTWRQGAWPSDDDVAGLLAESLPEEERGRLSFALAEYLAKDARRYGPLLAQLADGMAFPEAVKNSYGKAAEELVTQWAQASGR